MVKRGAPYRLTKPCARCPFLRGNGYLTPGRVTEIALGLVRGEFPCHETLDYENGVEGRQTERTAHCAGALILLEKMDRPSQMMRISERIGLYDRRKLDMTADVYDSFAEMKAAQGARDVKRKHKRRKGKIVKPTVATTVDAWSDDTRACILCGKQTRSRVRDHAACLNCRDQIEVALAAPSRSVSVGPRRNPRVHVIATHGAAPRTGQPVPMGSLSVAVVEAPTIGGRVEVEVIQGDTRFTSRAWSLLRPDGAEALGRALLDAAKRAREVLGDREPDDAERVAPKEVAMCARCRFRPAMVVVGNETVCEKCRANVSEVAT